MRAGKVVLQDLVDRAVHAERCCMSLSDERVARFDGRHGAEVVVHSGDAQFLAHIVVRNGVRRCDAVLHVPCIGLLVHLVRAQKHCTRVATSGLGSASKTLEAAKLAFVQEATCSDSALHLQRDCCA
eukprot:SAG11_NODE_924_length_6525_cov_5.604264_2_plen_127_part_00